MRTKLFITGLAFMALTTMLSAQNNKETRNQQTGQVTGRAFVDANKNGICDNFENSAQNVPDGKRNYYCRFNGKGQGQGQRLRNGTAPGSGRNGNFVDADKNGVCDYYEASSKK
jgi:hypothetical protein